jgi:tRNA 2-thiouridine synthesizing protein B
VLHIINKSPFSKNSLESCIRVAPKDDPILLTEDAVLGAMSGSSVAALVKDAQKNHAIYALSADIKARNVDRLVDGVKVIDYNGFVELVEQHRTMSWL